jgi:hypothetical protein
MSGGPGGSWLKTRENDREEGHETSGRRSRSGVVLVLRRTFACVDRFVDVQPHEGVVRKGQTHERRSLALSCGIPPNHQPPSLQDDGDRRALRSPPVKGGPQGQVPSYRERGRHEGSSVEAPNERSLLRVRSRSASPPPLSALLPRFSSSRCKAYADAGDAGMDAWVLGVIRYLIPLNQCRYETFMLPWKCEPEL